MIGPLPVFLSAVAMLRADQAKPYGLLTKGTLGCAFVFPFHYHPYTHTLHLYPPLCIYLHPYLTHEKNLQSIRSIRSLGLHLIDPPIVRASLLGNLDYQLYFRHTIASHTNLQHPGSINLRLLEL